MHQPGKMTKRRREVLYHVAYSGVHGGGWCNAMLRLGGMPAPVLVYKLHGVDVSEIVQWLARKKLVRLWYRPEQPHPAATLRCLCITPKGMEELLWPTM